MDANQTLPKPIAIVGSACRFPGESSTPSKLAELLRQPRDVRREFNQEILNLKRFYDFNPDAPGSTNVKNLGYLLAEDTRVFDASFFNISPYEAESMDPQLRVMLETVYEAFENGGFTLDQIRGSKTSVHVGVMASDYYDIQTRDPETVPLYAGTGVARSILSNRISYTFDLHGPSVTLDTACSSSLVALHQAVQGLQAGDATCAVVGGVNLIFDPMLYVMLSKLHMLSPDSQSRMWDKSVNGYARGEGAAAVVLKPLDQALRDNDRIEGIIRGTGVNSDGQSPGLTMPTVKAQAALIRETYRRAGLDPVADRCQYFECHGTGTPAGDPVESRAIYEAMIRDRDPSDPEPSTPLYVGSIKTLIGHLEGGAGLAGILKALLSIKHRTIFPNLLFNELNPQIQPYYGGFQIPTSPLPWPELSPGTPLRVSVNSFGFGGTNAHAIIESFDDQGKNESTDSPDTHETQLAPFILSANSGSSLVGNAQKLLEYLLDNPTVKLTDLNWALQSRRAAHRVRTFFNAQSHQDLVKGLEEFISQHDASSSKDSIGIRSRPFDPHKPSRVLGVFTGQGAQWPAMGRELLKKSPLFYRIMEKCDGVLMNLPDGPEWSLIEELSRDHSNSRVGEAVISQPLCTAIQIALIEVLTTSGIEFEAVVGHSSGEIAAVYACGIITATAAMQIAYYRGKFAHLAHGPNGQKGGMMAVGIDHDTAKAFCQQPEYQGRICVAASNAPKSVTLSGDIEAIQNAKEYFDQQQTFARLLKVDTAYHSHHMDLCVDSYLRALESCDISVEAPRHDRLWVSSVYGDAQLLRGDLGSLKGTYWVRNMVQTVLFSQAVGFVAREYAPFDLVVEVGPHPTLRGPTQQTMEVDLGASSPTYIGTLKRGVSDFDAIAETIGLVWCHLGPSRVNFEGFRSALTSGKPIRVELPQDLPSYSWDHDRIYWQESRISRNYRRSNDTRHPLLGRRVPDDTEREMRWRNVLRISELPWAQGHVVSGEALLPGTSYISISCEAANVVANGRMIRQVQLEDIEIRRPVIIPDTRQGLETTFTLRVEDSKDADVVVSNFSFYFSDPQAGSMVHACSGKIMIVLGEACEQDIPPCGLNRKDLHPVDSDAAYEIFAQNGLSYNGLFRRLQDVQRRLDYSVAEAEWSLDELTGGYSLHPAVLDVSWQNLFHARADPRAGRVPTTILPVRIKRVTINPHVELAGESTLRIRTESFVTARNGVGVAGDVHVYNSSTGVAAVQMESVCLEPIAQPTEDQDRQMFFDTVYRVDPTLRLVEPVHDPKRGQRVTELSADIERAVLFYVQRVLEGLTPDERSNLTWYHKRLVTAFESSVRSIREGRHPVAEQKWLGDKPADLEMILSKWSGTVDLECVRLVGENMLDFLRRQTSMLEVIMQDDLATRLYSEGCGLADVNQGMSGVLEQISHKFPQARYIEIGGGTGSATDSVLRTIGDAFETYTFTDISPAFFGDAAERFSKYRAKTIFKTLDVEKDVSQQGFQKQAYDVVVASNVLHATAQLKETLKNARSLLKPGGFLLLVEITGIEIMRTTFCVGGLPGWWLGAGEGRKLHPGLTTEEWHHMLQDTGFSGVDLVFHDSPDSKQHCMSFMASQAVNDTVQQLREPLEYLADIPDMHSLLIVGGKTLAVSKTVSAIQRLLSPALSSRVNVASDVEAIDFSRLGGRADVLCLQELDSPLFSESLAPRKLKALQTMVVAARNVLWITSGRRADSPYANMMVGMARAISKELPQVNMQFLDVDSVTSSASLSRVILEMFVRMKVLAVQEQQGNELFWLHEPELVMEDSDILVPRVRPDKQLNDRYNAKFRTITRLESGRQVSMGITRRRNRLILVESAPRSAIELTDRVSMRVQYSVSLPGQDREKIFLSIGRLVDSNMPVVAVSQRNTSVISVPRDSAAVIDEKDCNEAILIGITNQIVLTALLNSTNQRGSALLYNPQRSLAATFAAEASRRGLKVLCVSSHLPAPTGWRSIHPNSSIRAIKHQLPHDLKLYLDCSDDSELKTPLIESALPQDCKVHRWNTNLIREGLACSANIQLALEAAYASLPAHLVDSEKAVSLSQEIEVLNVEEIASTDPAILDRTHVVRWETSSPVSLLVQPPDTSVLFDGAKTYLMIGMAGGLGLSICGWAVRHGAKHLVITSRKPNIDPQWMADARSQGAEIQVTAMDAADRASLESTIHEIKRTRPPLGGVCNAAMVLSDKLFVDMNVDAIAETFKPKVDVSKHLVDILGDTHLDFFVMFSSALSITGGQGSANYHAANLFMTGLAAQRRKSGLPASVIHIGYVTDVGYFMRVDQSSREYIGRMRFTPLSETDIHHAFAEAVLAGRPGSERSCEVGIGIEPLDASLEEDEEPAWSSDPRFSHFLPTVNAHGQKEGPQFGHEDIKKQIQDLETEAEVVTVVQEALCVKIETMLQLPQGKVDSSALLTELGIDSLVAVEIRAWFLKKIGIDVPVVKILGRSSVAQICTDASKDIMATKSGTSTKSTDSEPETSNSSHNLSEISASETSQSGNMSPPNLESELAKDMDISYETEDKDSDEPELAFTQSFIHVERMSAAQARVYVLSGLVNDPTAYSLMIQYEIQDQLDIERLQNAMKITMQHHECLRTCFFTSAEDNQPMQGLLSFPVHRFKHIPNATEQDIAEELEAVRTKVWDIEHGETLSLSVLSRDMPTHTVVLGYHHIILDASGMRTFIRDLNSAYNRQSLKTHGGTCMEFARKEQEDLDSGKFESRMQYWTHEYSSPPDVLPLLPIARSIARPDTHSVENVHMKRTIDDDTVAKVKQACQTLGVTAFQFHLAVVQILLMQSLGVDDVSIGVVDANRPDTGFMTTVGFFLNLLPLRFRHTKGSTFAAVAHETSRKMGQAFENSVPFDMLLDKLNIPRSSSHTPLFQVLVNYRLAMARSIPFGSSHLTIIDGEEGLNPYDITISFLESHSEGLGVTVDCLESLYDADGTEKFLDMYMWLLKEVVQDVNMKVDESRLYNPQAVQTAVMIGQGKTVKVQWPETISAKFHGVCRAHPERISVQDRSSSLTYGQLATQVNTIAAALVAASQGTGSRVAVLCEPSNDFIASLLAILHIGAIYIPLDTTLPSTRHHEIISSCHPGLVIYHESTRELAEKLVQDGAGTPSFLALDDIKPVHHSIPCTAEANLPAFILYTSGTTGKPKGVVLRQAGMVNWLSNAIETYDLDKSPASVLQQSALSFDMSLIQIFIALCSGGTVITVPQELRRDPSQVASLIAQHNVAWTFAVPSEYLQWLRYGRESLRQSKMWRWALVGGEIFPVQLKHELRRLELPCLELHEYYGPTEITFTATSKPIPLDRKEISGAGSSIGKPHPNYSVCILDAKGKPLPIGFRGEICIGGAGIALGYWDRSSETNSKFIPDPTARSIDGLSSADRWYRTGDQGILEADGTLIFLGRIGGDTQVKLRGLRVELSEVEGALLKSGDSLITTAVVTVRDGDLIAHVILESPNNDDRDSLRRRILKGLNLPQYMHPARVIFVDDLPRASTGKIDRQAVMKLPLSNDGNSAGEIASDLSLREVELKLLWSRVLPDPYQVLTADSDFFLEGGNSLRLTKLQNEIKETLGISVSIRTLYSSPTLRQMAARIGSESASDEDIDWDLETAIPESVISALRNTTSRTRNPSHEGLNILLTGAAGVLGNAVLHALIEDPAVASVHCVAVTPDDEDRIPVSEKIIAYPGSLASRRLGLNESEYATLQSTIDVVIHAGANGHCLNSYSSIRRPNVESTHFLASLCMPRSIPLLYVSSQRVPALTGLKVLPPVPVLTEPAKTGDTGYMASRWVSERFLHKLSEHKRFSVEIHRPCLFFGDHAPPSDALNGVLRYTRLMRCIPRFARVEGFVDVKNVDDIARSIVSSAVSLAEQTDVSIRYRHHSSGRKVTLDEWPAYMEELYGEPFEVLELPEWIARARKAGIHPLIATYLEGVMEKEELGLFPYLGESIDSMG